MSAFETTSDDGTSTVVVPKRSQTTAAERRRQPRYHVILWDSDHHTYDYVQRMLRELFGHTQQACLKLAKTVDEEGRAVVLTTTKEHAELKRDQIHAYGKDDYPGCQGAMSASIEPEC